MESQDPAKWRISMLRAWQLALLRFAVTLDNTDRLTVMAIAAEIDRGGHRDKEPEDFTFFRKTSIGLCISILKKDESGSARLRQYLAGVDDPRLKRAFAAAVEIDMAPAVQRPKKRSDLWRGLTSRSPAPVPQDFISANKKH